GTPFGFRLSFEFIPMLLFPLLDANLIALGCTLDRFLRTIPDAGKQAATMTPVIVDAEDFLYHHSHALAGPNLTTKPEGFGSGRQLCGQLAFLLLAQFTGTIWRPLMAQGVDSLRLAFLDPLTDCSLCHA